MSDEDEMIVDLTATQCWDHLLRQQIGRLIFTVDGRIEIFLVNYIVDNAEIHLLPASGRKFDAFQRNQDVVFEVDQNDETALWSVTVRGIATVLDPDEKRTADRRQPIHKWVNTYKPHRVRIEPVLLSGRILPTSPFADTPLGL